MGKPCFQAVPPILAHGCGEKLGFSLPQLRDKLKSLGAAWEQGLYTQVHVYHLVCVSHEDNHLNVYHQLK